MTATVPNAQQPGETGYRGIKVGTESGVYRDGNLGNSSQRGRPYSRACLANMTAGSTEYKNRQRTIANQEATVRSTVHTLYNTCVTDRTALEAANAALATEQKKMSAVENQRRLGMVTDLAYLGQQVSLLSAQVSAATADMNLQQAIENYHFAMRGYISGVTVS